MRVLSGIQPSGNIHLGNYFGAIKQQIELQDKHECYYFIADYHALTSQRDHNALRQSVIDVASTYLALGLKPTKSFLYRQSAINEVAELSWILNCVTPVGLMQRAPAYKEKVEHGLSANMGLFSYPILMAADILIVGADLVPVGKDQLPHIDIAQDVAESFNSSFRTKLLKRPEPLLSPTPKVPGTDGQKMSKTYGNTIDVFADETVVRKQVARIVTDSRRPGEPGKYGADNATQILDLFLGNSEEREQWVEAVEKVGVGYKEIKQRIVELHQERFASARERFLELRSGNEVTSILRNLEDAVRGESQAMVTQVRRAVGLHTE